MVDLDKAIIARLDVKGEHFEILVDPDLAYMYKQGKKKDMANLLAVEEIFLNVRKGDRPPSDTLKKAFGTTDVNEIAKIILQKGHLQLTTEQRRKAVEEKKTKIIAFLSRECIDPRTGAPHPPQRILNALSEAKVSIDPFKDVDEQIPDIIDALRPLLPLKFEKVKIAVRIPAEYAPRAYGVLKEYGIEKEEWQGDGSLIVLVSMPAGVQPEFFDKINKLTSGNVETKVMR
ncbi:MAG: ribosome assembly factor SBDS [Candidatus Micrarchaeia archaeon]